MKLPVPARAAALLAVCGGGAPPQVSVFPTPLVRFIYASEPSDNAVAIFPGSANGNAAPGQTLSGTKTQLDVPAGLALNASALYVANVGGSITIYPPFVGGNIAPSAFVRGNLTQLTGPATIALDGSGTMYVTNNSLRSAGASDSIVAFPPTASGNVYPSQWIAGPATQLAQPDGIALDARSNIYVANTAGNSVTAYAPVSTTITPANEVPFLQIARGATGLSGPTGLAIDASGRLWVANGAGDTIEIFAPGTFGNVAPLFTIGGPATKLNRPTQISFDPFGDLDVANANGSIAVFRPVVFPFPASGNIAPSLLISGLNAPQGVAAL